MGKWTGTWRTLAAVVIAVGAALVAAGCVPWVNPPLRASVGGSAVAVEWGPQHRSGDREGDLSGVQLEATMHPLQAFRGQHSRHFDFGAGAHFRRLEDGTWVHGPVVEGAWFLHSWSWPAGAPAEGEVEEQARAVRLRIGLRERLRLFVGDVHGLSAATGVFAEVATFASGVFGGCDMGRRGVGCIAGAGHGEAGIGVYADVEYAFVAPASGRLQAYDRMHQWAVVMGLEVRLPASAGILVGIPLGL